MLYTQKQKTLKGTLLFIVILKAMPLRELFLIESSFVKAIKYANKIIFEADRLIIYNKEEIKVFNVNSMSDSDKGFLYEKYVGMFYESKGYSVEYRGLEKGFFDGGIDLIVSNENEVLYIQCKFKTITKSALENILYKASSLLFEDAKKYSSKDIVKNRQKTQFRIAIPSKVNYLKGKKKKIGTVKQKVEYELEKVLELKNGKQSQVHGKFLEIPFEYKFFNMLLK